ncbi:hypothetical protein BH747_00105 [Enterococcus villorum]|uniref:Uncharacterized protein n=1 Tax=Enterococcus villorum TaxID=112904 RepID=A0A1V8YFA9_9ENTE|nr:hypothetical protein [Enterococcus villorum]OQO71272.1 hypothetical protein BH747_00105 [Enterococcus villorum]OQO73543.1 hypothetical protein BH744_10045 [Enterococcus villorum]
MKKKSEYRLKNIKNIKNSKEMIFVPSDKKVQVTHQLRQVVDSFDENRGNTKLKNRLSASSLKK